MAKLTPMGKVMELFKTEGRKIVVREVAERITGDTTSARKLLEMMVSDGVLEKAKSPYDEMFRPVGAPYYYSLTAKGATIWNMR